MNAVEPKAFADCERAAVAFEAANPRLTLTWACEKFGVSLAMGTGFGPEGIVILDMLCQVTTEPRVFYLDTDFLFPETYELRNRLAVRYGIAFEPVKAALSPAQQHQRHGTRLWARDPDLCCKIRKVGPLAGYLATVDAWVTSIRRDQTTAREETKVVSWNSKFNLVKISPLATWTSNEVWAYP